MIKPNTTRIASLLGAGGVFLLLMTLAMEAATTNYYYVVPSNPSAASPYDTWGKAASGIQAAVDKASADRVPGTIECVVLVTNGTYSLTGPITITNGITLRGFGGRDATFINGNFPAYSNRCMEIRDAASRVTVDGFTISNGYNLLLAGGGIYVTNSVVSIVNCAVLRNRSIAHGGGIGLIGCTNFLIANCVISLNTNSLTASGGNGGGAFLYQSKGLMTGCTIASNVLLNSSAWIYGGGLYIEGTSFASSDLVVSNCVISHNGFSGGAADGGGGIHMLAGGTLTHCTISQNRTTSSSGGVQLYNSLARLTYSTIVSNQSGTGGGVNMNSGGSVYNCAFIGNYASSVGGGINTAVGKIRNCLFAANQSGGNGGGANTSVELGNCTFVANKAAAIGGGLYVSSATAPMTNVIAIGNTAATSNDVGGFASSLGYSCSPGLTPGVNGNITDDPLFVSAGSGSGTNAVLGDYTLQTNSPCMGAGTNLAWMTVDPVCDLAGNNRIRPFWGMVDMGAYEAYSAAGPLTNGVTATPAAGAAPLQVVFAGETSGNTNGLLWKWVFGDGATSDWSTNAVVSHTYAAARTNAYTASLAVTNHAGETAAYSATIMVYPPVVYVSTNGLHIPPFETWASAATNIQSAVDVAGAGFTTVLVSNGVYTVASEITIAKAITLRGYSGNWGDTIIRGAYPASTNRCLAISGAGAVVDGFTITNGNSYLARGGGIYMTAASTVQNCLIIGNIAVSTSAGIGGGIAAEAGSILNCAVQNNASTASGGGGGLHVNGAGVVVSNCLVTGNRATVSAGGGLRLDAGLVVNCILSNNVAGTSGGGGTKANTGAAMCRNCLVAGNQAATSGGGVNMSTGLRIENCTIAGNLAANGGGVFAAVAGLSGTNCIVANNKASGAGGTNDIAGLAVNFGYSCSPDLAAGVNGNITADPLFVNAGSGYGTNGTIGNYRLKTGSPCVDTGTNLAWMASAADLQGSPRILGAGPNMGAYEGTVAPAGTLMLIR